MSISHNHNLTAEDYDRLAWEYYRSLPLEHFMESTPQATQREIALAGLALLKTRRPDVHYFNELLVQYWHKGEVERVVPDNMVVLDASETPSRSSYAVELEDAPPFMVIEYVSSSSEGKDYEESFRKYEQELRVPYCVMYYPERLDLRVFRLEGAHYVRLEPDASGRVEIPELDLQIGMRDGWMRFWRQGELLDLPADLARKLEEQQRELAEKKKQLAAKTRQLSRKTKQLKEQASQFAALTQWLRGQVEDRARAAGRQDILVQAAAAEVGQLQTWLDELK